ncbi:helix-turn-helix domain-containing protein [Pseudobacteroides cellulosolvens]|uniref:Transcriptional regulator with only HTH domain, AraC family n=1 Tax=Pseudobacteroides cellulosolvens ATCC 35603 = DSM 2933 TaxID=398512 RepID=A0A0L6JQA7_9FIRM|nr:AraC family transcriptional regulator [Pseudobacteroides cellulosolvens]KNY27974.1 transcriptional regulator with only HTH domain, AraC family [Pseudobacteroides cellulosolvens ATCC 35603 = DSM 2933]
MKSASKCNIYKKDEDCYAIKKALEFIEKNYMKQLLLEEAASYCLLNQTYFCSLFKRYLNCSFVTYLNRVRIEKSKKLLNDSGLSLYEVSKQCGFKTQSYFTKVFKQETGISPGKFCINDQYLEYENHIDKIEYNSLFAMGKGLENNIKKIDSKTLTKVPTSVRRAIVFIDKNYMKKISLKTVADHVSLSRSYFCRVFKEGTGLSFIEFILRLRVEKSFELLDDPRINITDVSGMVGFEEQSYFSKVFKSITGQSPSNYRTSKKAV